MGRNLPWEESGYFCLFNEELVKYDESYIGRVFEEAGLGIRYDSAEGRYLVTRPDRRVAGAVKLVVFSKEGQLQEVIEPTYYRYKQTLKHPQSSVSWIFQSYVILRQLY